MLFLDIFLSDYDFKSLQDTLDGHIIMVMMVNCFYGMVDGRKALSLMSSWNHRQRFSPSQISETLRTGFETAQNLCSGFVEGSYAVKITTTPPCNIKHLET